MHPQVIRSLSVNDTTEQIVEYLNSLEKGSVVGLDGYSGIGKTTIANEIEKVEPGVKVLHMDDYVVTANTKDKLEPQVYNHTPELALEWKDVGGKGFSSLKSEVDKFKNRPDSRILLMEGIFFMHPDVLPNTFDKVIFLSGDEAKSDERRVKREKERWGDKYFPETHPDSFTRLFKIAWKRYKELYKPVEKADLVVKV